MNPDLKTSVPGNGYQNRNEEWRLALYEAASEVFALMVGEPVSLQKDATIEGGNDTTAMVGLAGALCGILSIRCSASAATGIASKMLGEPEPSSDCIAQQWDALGEICNMIAGNFKARVEGLREQCMLSVPTVITGQDYSLHSLAEDDRLEVALLFQNESIILRLEVHG
jgi:chemotaxis protein CheX